MGHLICLKRYWRIASDELFISGFLLYVIRFIWFVLIITTLGFSASRVANCQYGGLILFYLTISTLLIYLSILIEYYIVKISMQDTICENKKRDQSIIKFVLARLSLCFGQVLTAIFGCLIIASQSQIPCSSEYKYAENNVDLVLLSIVAISQLIEGSLIFCCCFCMSSRSVDNDNSTNTEIVLNKTHSTNNDHHNHASPTSCAAAVGDVIQHKDSSSSQIDSTDNIDVDHTHDHMIASDPTPTIGQIYQLAEEEEEETIFTWPLKLSRNKFFETFLRYLFRCFQTSTCNLFGGNNIMDDTFEELSEIVTSYFHHDGFLDIVPSDVVAGLLLCYRQQIEWKRRHNIYKTASLMVAASHTNPLPQSSSPSSPSSPSIVNNNSAASPPIVYNDENYDNIERGLGSHGGNQIRQLNPLDTSDRKLIADAYRYSALALSMNTHLWVCLIHPVTAPCRLCYTNIKHTDGPCNCFCFPCCRTPSTTNDSSFKKSTKSIIMTTKHAKSVSSGTTIENTVEPSQISSSQSPSSVVAHEVNPTTTPTADNAGSSRINTITLKLDTTSTAAAAANDEPQEPVKSIIIIGEEMYDKIPDKSIINNSTTTASAPVPTTTHKLESYISTNFNTETVAPPMTTVPSSEVAIGGSETVTYSYTNNGCCCCFTPNLFLCNTKELHAKVHKSHYRSSHHHHHRDNASHPSHHQQPHQKHINAKQYSEKLLTGDNCLRANESGLLELVHESGNESELKFASFHNDIHIKPYAIFHDWESNSIVISVRGTLSIEDAITDCICHATELTKVGTKWGYVEGDVENRYAHRGMLMAAARIREDIERVGLLYQLMNEKKEITTVIVDNLVDVNHSNNAVVDNLKPQQLVVTGHSLGAGVAVLLAYLLKPTYTDRLTCITFGTPNTIFDTVTALEVTSYVTSICNQYDLVCRAGYKPTVKMRADILDCIARAKTNKATVFKAGFFYNNSHKKSYISTNDLMYPSASAASTNTNGNGAPTGLATGETLTNSGDGIVQTNISSNTTNTNTANTNGQNNNNNSNNNDNTQSSSIVALPVDNAYRASLRKYIALMNYRIQPKHFIDLVIPGRVIQINMKAQQEGDATTKPTWLSRIFNIKKSSSPQYIPYESHYLNYSSFEIHPDMAVNHMPHYYTRVLKSIAMEWEKIIPPTPPTITPTQSS